MFGGRDLGFVKDLDAHGIPLVHQGREADQRLPALADLHELGQLAKGPGGVTLLGGDGGGGRLGALLPRRLT